MNNNDLTLIDRLIGEYVRERLPREDARTGEVFLRFSLEQVLRPFELDDEEISAGITEHADDGGVDAFYWFVDGRLGIRYTETPARVRELKIVLLQSKRHDRFEEQPLKNLRESIPRLASLSPASGEARAFSPKLLELSAQLQEFLDKNLTRIDRIFVSVIYASRGKEIGSGVAREKRRLEDGISTLGTIYSGEVRLVGAKELVELARWAPPTTFALKTAKMFALGDERNASYVCLLKLGEYFRLVTHPDGTIRQDLLNENVRDHLGAVTVNRAIGATLAETGGPDFWWLNNGVTLIAESVTTAGEQLKIVSPRIVNGLQTTHELVNHFARGGDPESDPRHVLARIVVIDSDEIRERIIAATNQQSAVPLAQLWATRTIHRDLEDYFLTHGYFYERRKNRYKNERKPVGRIFSIAQVAQAVMATLLGRPNDARARPSSLLDSEETHDAIFNGRVPLETYLKAALICREADYWLGFEPRWMHPTSSASHLKVVAHEGDSPTLMPLFPATYTDRTNLRFFLAFAFCRLETGTLYPTAKDLASIDLDRIWTNDASVSVDLFDGSESNRMVLAVHLCWRAFVAAGRTDKAAKGVGLLEELTTLLRRAVPASPIIN